MEKGEEEVDKREGEEKRKRRGRKEEEKEIKTDGQREHQRV